MSETLADFKAEVLSCTKCPALVASRNRIAFGYGSGINGIMIIGEAPSQVGGNLTGIPFSSAHAGEFVQSILREACVTREECYITNTCYCSPPKNRKPDLSEISNCSPYKIREMEILSPHTIILLGAVASKTFSWLVRRNGALNVVSLQHPSFILRQNSASMEATYRMNFIAALLKSKE